MRAITRTGDALHLAASEAGIRVLRVVRPDSGGYVFVVPRRRDAARLALAARLRCSVRGSEMHVLAPEFVVDGTNTRVVDGAPVTVVPEGVDPWLHHGPTWDVTIRASAVPAVVARLGAR